MRFKRLAQSQACSRAIECPLPRGIDNLAVREKAVGVDLLARTSLLAAQL
jgi:hypothetical protein